MAKRNKKQNQDMLFHSTVLQAIDEEHNTLVGRLCSLLEVAISDDRHCCTTKKLLKDLVRDEQDRVKEFLSIIVFTRPDDASITEYVRYQHTED